MASLQLDIIRINTYLENDEAASKIDNTNTGVMQINCGDDKLAFLALLNSLDDKRVVYEDTESGIFGYCYSE